jgi:hypothetical protein
MRNLAFSRIGTIKTLVGMLICLLTLQKINSFFLWHALLNTKKFRCIEDRSWIKKDAEFPNGGIVKGEIYHGEVFCDPNPFGTKRIIIVEKPNAMSYRGRFDLGWDADILEEVSENTK